MNIHQMSATMSMGDAISNEVLALQKLLLEMGYKSEIYAENIDPRLSAQVKNYKKYKYEKDDIIIHHFGIGSDLNDFVFELPNKNKILRYHNVTPYEFFRGYNGTTMQLCQRGREQLEKGIKKYKKCLADSEYNKEELVDLGYSNIEVIPILLALDDYKKEPEESIIEKYKDGKTTNIIFVGRVAPNKKQEDIIRSFYFYKKYFNNKSRLFLVGSYGGMEAYYKQLVQLVDRLGLEDVYFTGHIPFKEILAYYHIADLFLCMSEHEGFCVPLVESMFFKVPIMAYSTCAIPYTLGKGGVLVKQKKYLEIAAMMDYICNEKSFKDIIVDKQSERLEALAPEIVKEQFRKYILQEGI